ncbi:MAG TPA: DUF2905 domain-containing protein [Terriglobia bacterium]|jgi:hypothetical protein|nr:DUF2905 domain-containing protein [Terriglobia bacterium]
MDSAASHFGKLLVFAGVALIVTGALLIAGSKVSFFGLGRLPGDINYRGRNVSFYFPLVSCLIVSALVTLLFWLISFLGRR